MLRRLKEIWTHLYVTITNQERAYLLGIDRGIDIGRQMADVQYAPIVEQLRQSTLELKALALRVETVNRVLDAFKGDKPS